MTFELRPACPSFPLCCAMRSFVDVAMVSRAAETNVVIVGVVLCFIRKELLMSAILPHAWHVLGRTCLLQSLSRDHSAVRQPTPSPSLRTSIPSPTPGPAGPGPETAFKTNPLHVQARLGASVTLEYRPVIALYRQSVAAGKWRSFAAISSPFYWSIYPARHSERSHF